jgi:hypothetical protein
MFGRTQKTLYMFGFETYVSSANGRRYISACVCGRCGRITNELHTLRCTCGEIMDEYALTTTELMRATSQFN